MQCGSRAIILIVKGRFGHRYSGCEDGGLAVRLAAGTEGIGVGCPKIYCIID